MMPNNILSQVTEYYKWSGINQFDPTGGQDFEAGGVQLNNNSLGMQYQLWTFSINNMSAEVTAPNQTAPTTLFTLTSPLQQIAGTFDQNMAPFVAYESSNQWNYWWYDTVSAGYVFSALETGVTSCRCCLDDTRQFNALNSDILLFYTLNNNLYMRRQRDRYQNEMLLKAGVGGTLIKVGMNGIERLQFKMLTTQ